MKDKQYDIEEIFEMIENMDEDDDEVSMVEYYFTNPDPYPKVDPSLYERKRYDFWLDEAGQVRIKNLSAYWIPELTVTEVIHGTVYTVTGSYEGTESFVRKLERITAKNFIEKGGENP